MEVVSGVQLQCLFSTFDFATLSCQAKNLMVLMSQKRSGAQTDSIQQFSR